MPHNRAFWRALHALAHPLSIGAILLLLLNDHWLRHTFPSWLTGKLGDFSWLIFAPFIAALVFSLILPHRINHHDSIVRIVSFGFIGLWFALAKTIPAVHDLTKTAWESLVGWEGMLRLDPTDLLTLPALLIGGWVWRRADDSPVSLRPLAYVALGLGIVATLATSFPMRDSGLNCIMETNERLMAISNGYYQNAQYISDDGGYTWTVPEEYIYSQRLECGRGLYSEMDQGETFTITDPNNPHIRYSFQPAQSIDISTDNGQTWTHEFDLSEVGGELHRVYHARKDTGEMIVADPGPFDARIHQATGNLVVAMGHDGILLRTPDGQWQWITVGPYFLPDTNRLEILPLLKTEFILAGILGLLLIPSLTLTRSHWFITLILMLAWSLWVMSVLFPPPKWETEATFRLGYFTSSIVIPVTGVLAIFLAWFGFDEVLNEYREPSLIRPVIGGTIFVMVLFLLPYLLWAQGTIPRYATATVFALILAASGLIAGYVYLKPRLPILKESKR